MMPRVLGILLCFLAFVEVMMKNHEATATYLVGACLITALDEWLPKR